MKKQLETIMKTLFTAAAYWAAGRLALFLAIPPGYATPVWPAAGIALALMILWGYPVWPGIAIGSFFVNLWTSFDASSTAAILKSLSLATSIGLGASLQAIVGTFLVRRFVGWPNSLAQEKDVLKFILLTGPVSCLVAATVGVTSLLSAGAIQSANYGFNWFTWWVGDTIGVVLLAPLILIWSFKSAEFWRHRRMAVSLPVGMMLVLAIVLYIYASRSEQNRIKLELNGRTDQLASTLKEDFEGYLDVLYSIESLYAGPHNVERQEFRKSVRRFFSLHPGLHALSWNPRILASERLAFEESMQKEGFQGLQITEQNEEKQLVRAGNRSEYVVVDYIEPYEGNEKALGFDVASDPVRYEALVRARDEGKPVATGRIRLVQEKEGQFGFLIFLPVYKQGLPSDTVEERRRNLEGFAVGAFRAGDLAETPLKGAYTEGIEIALFDDSASEPNRLFYDRGSEARSLKESLLKRTTIFEMAGRQWRFEFSVAPQ